MNTLVPQGNQLPSDPAQLKDYYAKYAEEYAQSERKAGSSISLRNGIMSVGDQAIPGNQFAAIILDAVRINTFYRTAFNPQSVEPPTCYAIGRSDMEMAPHPDMAKAPWWFQPQSQTCSGCPHNQFGTARQGQGKACSNRRKFLLLVAGTYQQKQMGWELQPINNMEHYQTSPLLSLSIPPTSAAGWGAFVRDVAAKYQRPPFGVIARVYIYAHPKHGKEAVGFEMLAPLPDDWLPAVMPRLQEAQQDIMQGYEAPPQNQQQAPQAPGGGFRQPIGSPQPQQPAPQQGQWPQQPVGGWPPANS